jgi:hypothetical protein
MRKRPQALANLKWLIRDSILNFDTLQRFDCADALKRDRGRRLILSLLSDAKIKITQGQLNRLAKSLQKYYRKKYP